MKERIHRFDARLIRVLRRIEVPLARSAIAIVYIWFGALKVFGFSPAEGLVTTLFEKTMFIPIPFATFYILFALYEILIGLLFLFKGWERIGVFFLGAHLVMTTMPLLLLPSMTWQGFLVPTLEGQYIIKNVLILSVVVGIGAKLIALADRYNDAKA
jgi:uncharacterized membrane protein YkgB